MPTTIKLKNSVTTTNAPSSLLQGEVAINITDKKVWVGNAATTPIQLLGDGGSASFTSIAFGAGTVSSPSITFTGDTNTGIYSPAADTIAFTEGGVESMRILADGSVGIGTNVPGSRLAVNGGALPNPPQGAVGISGGLTTGRFGTYDSGTLGIIGNAADATSFEIITGSTAGFYAGIAITGSNATLNQGTIRIATDGTERMRIAKNGNIGINNSSPTFRLDSMGSLALGTSARSGITIGTTTGMYVYQTNNGGSFEIAAAVGGTGGPSGVNALSKISFFASNTDISTNNAIPITIGTNGSERMRIDSSGNVGIGTSSPTNFAGYTTVDAFNSGTGAVFLVRNSTKTGQFVVDTNGVRAGARTNDFFSLVTNDTERMRIYASGGVSINNTTDPGAGNLSVTGAISATTAFRETNGSSTIANGATFNITIPTVRRPQILTLYSTYNLYQTSLVLVVGDASGNISANFIYNGGGLAVAGTASNIVRITNNLGGTAAIYWSLLPLGQSV